MAAAGLWTTPADLCRYVIGIQKLHRGEQDALLNSDLAKQMLTRQIENWGLGFPLTGQGRSLSFSHGGSNQGFECFMVGYAETGQGAVIMTNTNGANALMMEMLRNLGAEYGWPR
jgi:hypothetical protein